MAHSVVEGAAGIEATDPQGHDGESRRGEPRVSRRLADDGRGQAAKVRGEQLDEVGEGVLVSCRRHGGRGEMANRAGVALHVGEDPVGDAAPVGNRHQEPRLRVDDGGVDDALAVGRPGRGAVIVDVERQPPARTVQRLALRRHERFGRVATGAGDQTKGEDGGTTRLQNVTSRPTRSWRAAPKNSDGSWRSNSAA